MRRTGGMPTVFRSLKEGVLTLRVRVVMSYLKQVRCQRLAHRAVRETICAYKASLSIQIVRSLFSTSYRVLLDYEKLSSRVVRTWWTESMAL